LDFALRRAHMRPEEFRETPKNSAAGTDVG
jgi:hypothetical protein